MGVLKGNGEIMGKLIIVIIALSAIIVCNGVTLQVPLNFDTIQDAIDVSIDGDVVIVSPGTYYEMVNFDGKAITVASLYYTTQDTSYISQTVIDGDMDEQVVVFYNEEGVNSVLTGFTITHGFTTGQGGGIYAGGNCSPTLTNLRIVDNQAEFRGGGFYFGESCSPEMSELLIEGNRSDYGGGGAYNYYCNLIMENSVIRNNVSEDCGGGLYSQAANAELENVIVENNSSGEGGGLYFGDYGGSVSLNNVIIQNNQAIDGAGIYSQTDLHLESVLITDNTAVNCCGGLLKRGGNLTFAEESSQRSSIYLNEAGDVIGRDIYSYGGLFEIYLAEFTVMEPTIFYAYPASSYFFDIQSEIVAQVDADLYVSPSGSDGNSGLSASAPLKTIRHATEMILPRSENPHTIHLAEGAYCTFTSGESFPVYIPQNVNIKGENKETVVLVGDGSSSVMSCEYVNNITISDVTLTNGGGHDGAGLYSLGSDITLENMLIIGNDATGSGGGLQFDSSTATLKDMIIANNTSEWEGGAIALDDSDLQIINVTSTGNEAGSGGGGIYIEDSDVTFLNSIFWNDSPDEVCFRFFSSDTLMVAFSNIEGGEEAIEEFNCEVLWLDGNIDEDPLFVDVEHGNFQLMDNSPCIDAGVAYFEYEGLVFIDLADDDFLGIAPDMGACDFVIVDNDNSIIENGKWKMENYPNPFNPVTTIAYQIAEVGNVKLEVYNVKGQRIRKLRIKDEGLRVNSVVWDGKDDSGKMVGSGVYFCRLRCGDIDASHKMLLLK